MTPPLAHGGLNQPWFVLDFEAAYAGTSQQPLAVPHVGDAVVQTPVGLDQQPLAAPDVGDAVAQAGVEHFIAQTPVEQTGVQQTPVEQKRVEQPGVDQTRV